MRNFIFTIESSKVVTVGAVAYFLLFGGDATAREICIDSRPQLVRTADPAVVVDESVRRAVRFQQLVARWRAERGATSLSADIAAHPAYHEIMGMGANAIPLILAQMKTEGNDPDHWFWALTVLTGVNPVPQKDRGDTVKMAIAWLDWGEQEGYVR